MKYQDFLSYLLSIKDEENAAFVDSLSNSDYISLGIKAPLLKEIAKRYKDDNELILSDFEHGKYLEVESLFFAIGLSRCKNIDEQLLFLDKYLKYVNSWVVTDSINHYLKKCHYETFLDFFKLHYDNKHIYTRRYSYVFALKFYKDKRILDIFKYIKENDEYMVLMAEAWLLSFIAVPYSKETYDFLKTLTDVKLIRKTISKISDSYRFDIETKNMFKSLREGL